MQPYLAFAQAHWELFTAFVIVLLIYLAFELKTKLGSLPAISPQETVALTNREEAIVLDIRDNAQFSKGHILGAINIPAADLEQKIKQLEKYKNKTVILVQNMGQSVEKAAALLQNNGFSHVKNLNGGMNAWLNANLPLAKK